MFECSVREVFVTGLILVYATAAVAQDNDNRNDPARKPFYGSGGSTLIYLLTKPGIQQELDLDEAASKPLLESLREIDPKHSSFRTLQERQQIRTRFEETKQKSAAAIQKALSEEQFRRFQQLELQYLDGRALRPRNLSRWKVVSLQTGRAVIWKRFVPGSPERGQASHSPRTLASCSYFPEWFTIAHHRPGGHHERTCDIRRISWWYRSTSTRRRRNSPSRRRPPAF